MNKDLPTELKTDEENNFYPKHITGEIVSLKEDPKEIINFIRDNSDRFKSKLDIRALNEFEALRALIWTAQDSDDFTKLASIYGLMHASARKNANKSLPIMSPGAFMNEIITAGGSLLTDRKTGKADPEKISDLVMPALETTLSNQYLRDAAESNRNNLEGSIFGNLSRFIPRGTAERKSCLILAREINSNEQYSVSRDAAIFKESYKPGVEYFTWATLEELRLPKIQKGPEALENATSLMVRRIKSMGESGNTVASQIAGAFQKLNTSDYAKSYWRSIPIQSIIKISNMISKQLNNKLDNSQKIDFLDENNISSILDAYLVMLYAIDEKTFEEAIFQEVNIDDASDIRREIIMIQAYIDIWMDFHNKTSENIGELALRLTDEGIPMHQIARKIQKDLNKPSKSDTATIRGRGHAYWKRGKAGYGLMS